MVHRDAVRSQPGSRQRCTARRRGPAPRPAGRAVAAEDACRRQRAAKRRHDSVGRHDYTGHRPDDWAYRGSNLPNHSLKNICYWARAARKLWPAISQRLASSTPAPGKVITVKRHPNLYAGKDSRAARSVSIANAAAWLLREGNPPSAREMSCFVSCSAWLLVMPPSN